MAILEMDHFSIRTDKLDETKAFFVDVIGLETGFRPPFKFPGAWLYLSGRPVLHILGIDENLEEYLGVQENNGSGSADHVAFRCEEPDEIKEKLKSLGVDFFERIVPESNTLQFFIKEPNGFTVELIFLL